MGLDIYLYRIKKPYLEANKKYSRKELLDINKGIVTLNEAALKEAPGAIRAAAVPVIVTDKFYNKEKVCTAANVDVKECSYLSLFCERWRSDDTHEVALAIRNRYGHTIGNIILTGEQVDAVLEEKDTALFAFLKEKVAYQRGGIDDYDFLPENCEYCTDLSVVKMLTEHGLSEQFVEKWSEDTCFYAWW